MIHATVGYRRLLEVADLVRALGASVPALDHWWQHRYPDVRAQLDQLRQAPELVEFMDAYAAPLVERIENMLHAGHPETAAELPLDLLEELLRQTRRCADNIIATPQLGPAQLPVDQKPIAEPLAQAA